MNAEDYQAIADLTMEALGFPHIETRVKDIWGAGRFNPHYITLPKWIGERGETFETYYVIHEVCHYEAFTTGKPLDGWHNADFKRLETRALALWGITIDRLRVYPKKLYLNGVSAYKKDDWEG